MPNKQRNRYESAVLRDFLRDYENTQPPLKNEIVRLLKFCDEKFAHPVVFEVPSTTSSMGKIFKIPDLIDLNC